MPYVHVADLRIHYQEAGQGAPLVLLHGSTGVIARHWLPQLAGLSPYYRVIALDLRGHGRTNNPAGALDFRQMADDVAGFGAALGLARYHICGFSLGAVLGLYLALAHPDRVASLILVGACYEVAGSTLARGDTFVPEKIEREDPEWAAALKANHATVYGPEYWRTLCEQLSVAWTRQPDLRRDDPRRIHCPTLVARGDRDEVMALEQSLDLWREIPGAELFLAPGAPHMFHTERASLFNLVALDFLRRRAGLGQ
ncbi:MAG: alpha/beta hydrolase [Chloroflexi bacterium]|nr:alpha/beta hydrolase [Chloroflexota bacterium]